MKNFSSTILQRIAARMAGFVLIAAIGYACTPVMTTTEQIGVASYDTTVPDVRVRKIFSSWSPAEKSDGVCRARHAKLILHSDGSREWEVELFSTQPGVRWE